MALLTYSRRNNLVVLMAVVTGSMVFGFRFMQPRLPVRAQDKPAAIPFTTARPGVEAPILLFGEKEVYGKYYFGDGLGVNCTLELQPRRRFAFRWTGCLGVYDQNAGTWELQGDTIICKPEKPNRTQGFKGMNTRYVPVKWGKRYYLVDENEMPGFCAAASTKKGRDQFDINFVETHPHEYVRWNGEKVPPVQGEPLLPERYKTFYEKGEVLTRVAKVMPDGNVVLDKGDADRLKPGMLLAINAFENLEVKVISTTDHSSIAQPRYVWNSDRSVKVGDKLTTGNYWNRPHGTGFETFAKLPDAQAKQQK